MAGKSLICAGLGTGRIQHFVFYNKALQNYRHTHPARHALDIVISLKKIKNEDDSIKIILEKYKSKLNIKRLFSRQDFIHL